NNLKQDNDEAYNRANGNVDLDEIKRIAIQEYGMTYASEGQIISYSDEGGSDYVRQIAAIPGSGGK
ncbi:MAG: cell division protein FtsL, partial [Eubacterium sp.]|nr:cell division protein FtsL [Eubacterium sp.]